MALNSFLNKVKEKATEALDKSKGQVQKSFQDTLNELNELKPLLLKSGYIIGDLKITLGLPLGVTVVIEKTEGGSVSLEVLRENNELTKTQKSLVNSLIKAHKLDSVFVKKGYTMGQIEIGLTIPPSINLHLNSIDSRSFSTAYASLPIGNADSGQELVN